MESSPSTEPPASKTKRGLARLTFKSRPKNNQASAAPQLTHRASVHRKVSIARKDSRRQSRLAAGRRNSKRVSLAQKRISAGSRISGRSHSPSTPATTAARAVSPAAATAVAPRAPPKSGGGLLRRLTRHFTSKKTQTPPPPPPPVPVPARLAVKIPPPASRSTPVVPAIVQPPSSNPQSRSPTPAGQRPRSKSPAPSTASKNNRARSPRPPSPDRVSLASWRYPPLPPSPVPPSPSFASQVPPFSPSLSSPSQALSPAPPSPGPAFLSSPTFPGQPSSPTLASPAPASEFVVSTPAPELLVPSPASAAPEPTPAAPEPTLAAPEPTLAAPEPDAPSAEPQETVEHESTKPEDPVDFLSSPQEIEVPALPSPAIPPTPALVQSDTESSAGHHSVQPLTPTMPPDEDDSQVSRGRRPRRKDTPLLMVPGGDSDAPPSLMEDDEDAWTDDEGVPTKSKEHLPLIQEDAEIPRICSTPERRPLTVIVPPSGGLTVTVDVTSSPTEMMMGTPTILEPVNEGDEDEFPSNPRWSQAPKTGGIEFILPAEPDDAPLKTSQSDKPRSQTLDPNSVGLRPGAMRRSTTFSRIFNFGSKKDLATLAVTPTDGERSPTPDRMARGMSIVRGPSRLEVEANRLPTRAPTVYAMSNAEIADQLENLRSKRMSMSPGTHTPIVVDDETARVTELAYF
ncbi:hypothetical protein FRC04_009709 [Tulasnella sp. 424]|nr:hypothetical protein FRC04_009709 [Tulasnella sp. 424]